MLFEEISSGIVYQHFSPGFFNDNKSLKSHSLCTLSKHLPDDSMVVSGSKVAQCITDLCFIQNLKSY